MTATEALAVTGDARAYRWRWMALAVILAGSAMELLDATVTNIAGPAMRAELGGSAGLLQWLGAAYLLAMTAGLLTSGRLGDIVGRRRMFLIGAGGFTIGSLLVATAGTPETVVAARVVQGLCGAAMVPQGFGLIKEMFPPPESQTALAAFGPVMGLAAAGGPVLAGWLVDADVLGTGWRMIFLINLPIGVATVAAALRFLPASRAPHPLRLDLVGAVLAAAAGLLLIYPLVQGREHGWPAWAFAMMAGSALLFVLFGWYETRAERAGGDPLVLPSLFRKRAFTGGLLVGVLLFASMAGFMLVFNVFLQVEAGYSPSAAGLAMLPYPIGVIVAMGALPSLRRFGRAVLHAGVLVNALGIAGVIATVAVGGWRLIPALLVAGVGAALLMGPYLDFVLAGVEPAETGSASGTITAVQQLGGALGLALVGTVFFDSRGSLTPALWLAAGLVLAAFPAGFFLPRHTADKRRPS
ncbi:MFS transporter [Actinoplanes sp. NPDC049668]|uniref:MFS transporter n=1 Tax=unclassified Actinoplanes TaxID=2626549 RepID=UPI0033A6C096